MDRTCGLCSDLVRSVEHKSQAAHSTVCRIASHPRQLIKLQRTTGQMQPNKRGHLQHQVQDDLIVMLDMM